jgi:hypothetical protein
MQLHGAEAFENKDEVISSEKTGSSENGISE